jgi:heme/copper-type cytochrome/quinol oxidase subunit 1
MTLTESKPAERAADVASPGALPAAPDEAPQPPPPKPGVERVLATSDHKVVGRAYLLTSLLLLAGALVLQVLVGAEGADASSLDLFAADDWAQVFTLANLGVVFLGLIPALLGLAIYVVPLQVGSRAVAFPRAAAASYWGFLIGAILFVAGYIMNGGVGGTDLEGVLISYSSLGLVLASLLLATVCVLTTVVALRPEGMSIFRVPVFAWSMFVAGIIWVISLPVLGANLLLLYVDSDHGAVTFAQPGLAWPQLRWVVLQPAVFALAIPVFGIAADVVSTLGRSRLTKRAALFVPIGAFGALSFGAWAQTAFNPDLVREATYVVMGVAIVLPALAVLGGLADTARRGRARLHSSFLLAMLAVLGVLAAALAGAANAIPALDLAVTVWGEGVARLVFGSVLLALAAGLAYWGPKIWGYEPVEGLSKLNVLVLLGGTALFGAGDLIAGGLGQLPSWPSAGQPDLVEDGAEVGQLLVAIGGALLVLGVVLVLLAHLPAATGRTAAAPADPWDGATLEWATASPPPFANFEGPLPPVGSPEPLLDLRAADGPTADQTIQEVE